MFTGSGSSTPVLRTSLLVSFSGCCESSSHEATIHIFRMISVPWGLGKEAKWVAAGHIRSHVVLPAHPAGVVCTREGRPALWSGGRGPTPTPGHFPGLPQESEIFLLIPWRRDSLQAFVGKQ